MNKKIISFLVVIIAISLCACGPVKSSKCIFRKNCASVPKERCAIPLQTEQSSAG